MPRVGKADLAQFQSPFELGAVQWALLLLALLRQGHQRVGAGHGQARLLIAGDQPGDLSQWRENPAAEHVAGYQGADAEVAGDDQVHPADDGGHAGELLQEQRAVGGQRGQELGMTVQAGEGAVGLFPLMLAFALGAARLEHLQAAQGLDQQRLTLRAELQALLHGVAQARLDDEGEQCGQRERQQRDEYQWPADQADHQQHQQGEGQVDQAGQRNGGEEVAQALEVVDALGKAPDGGGPGFHRHAGDALEQGSREHHVGLLAGCVQQMGAQHLQKQLEAGADQQADGQDPERRGGLVGHHAVVSLHDEQRHHQAQQVDQQAGQHGVCIEPARQLQGVAEPGFDARYQRGAGVFQFMPWAGEEGLATVLGGQLFTADPLFAAIRLTRQDLRLLLGTPLAQHGAATILE